MIVLVKKFNRKEGRGLLRKTEKFFKDNPNRKVCRIGICDDIVHKVRRGHVIEDLQGCCMYPLVEKKKK